MPNKVGSVEVIFYDSRRGLRMFHEMLIRDRLEPVLRKLGIRFFVDIDQSDFNPYKPHQK